MKKIYYLLTVVIVAFSACQKQPNLAPTTITTSGMNLTLATPDYQLLPSADYPHTALAFYSYADANTYIPLILAKRDPQLGNGSTANITFNLATPAIAVPDSLASQNTYTLVSADYTAAGSKYGDLSASEFQKFLAYKYPAPVASQLEVLSYVLYANDADTNVTQAWFYLSGAWTQIYLVSNPQYTIANEGKYDQFDSTDLPNLVSYFNYFLKGDQTIADTAKVNDIEYVSYAYYASGNYQKVMALTYNGNNWGVTTMQAILPFIKTNGTWASNASVYHTLTAADITLISNSTFGTAAQRSNLASYGDFETSWTAADLDSAFILVLTTDYPTPTPNVNYVVTYLLYTGGNDVSTQLTFKYNVTSWSAVATASAAKRLNQKL
jgi:hypothetical protein